MFSRDVAEQIVGGSEPVPYPPLKSVTDKTIAAALIVLATPVLLVVWVVMTLDLLLVPADRGGWLYRERRISRGREFDLLKFRTLRGDVLRELRHEAAHSRVYEADERNLTWAGRRVLKPWYLDELPQLVNVLRGDISLVGPRPWPVSMVADQVADGLDYRKLIRAGWTGPAQVRKAERASVVPSDLAYVDACRTWSSWRLVRWDLAILWETLKLMLRREGLRL